MLAGLLEQIAFGVFRQRRAADARQAVLAFGTCHMVREHIDVDDQAPRLVRNDLAPVRLVRRMDRRCDDTEVLSAVRVGRDDEMRSAMLDTVLMSDTAPSDDFRRA